MAFFVLLAIVFFAASNNAAVVRVQRSDDLVGSVEVIVQQLTQQVSTLNAKMAAVEAKTGE